MNKALKAAIASDELVAATWPRCGLVGYVGSMAHGTAGDIIDDIDLYGVFVGSPAHYCGLTRTEHVCRVAVAGRYDFALYEIQKYARLLLKSNPNVLSLLWLPDNLYVIRRGWGAELVANRHLWMSKVLYRTFGGYAYEQLRKMTRPPTKQAYQGAKRRVRFEKFGYDCKNAAHLVRLLRMGIEALSLGAIIVQRPDAAELKEIKDGKWTLGQVKREAERLCGLLDAALANSTLPDRPDFKATERLVMQIVGDTLGADNLF